MGNILRGLMAVLSVALIGSVLWSVSDNSLLPSGDYHDVNSPIEWSITVSSLAVVTSTAVVNGVQRIYQNTGSTNLSFFYNLSQSSVTANKYLLPGQFYIEDRWFGNIYFKVQAGSGSSTLSQTTFTNLR